MFLAGKELIIPMEKFNPSTEYGFNWMPRRFGWKCFETTPASVAQVVPGRMYPMSTTLIGAFSTYFMTIYDGHMYNKIDDLPSVRNSSDMQRYYAYEEDLSQGASEWWDYGWSFKYKSGGPLNKTGNTEWYHHRSDEWNKLQDLDVDDAFYHTSTIHPMFHPDQQEFDGFACYLGNTGIERAFAYYILLVRPGQASYNPANGGYIGWLGIGSTQAGSTQYITPIDRYRKGSTTLHYGFPADSKLLYTTTVDSKLYYVVLLKTNYDYTVSRQNTANAVADFSYTETDPPVPLSTYAINYISMPYFRLSGAEFIDQLDWDIRVIGMAVEYYGG